MRHCPCPQTQCPNPSHLHAHQAAIKRGMVDVREEAGGGREQFAGAHTSRPYLVSPVAELATTLIVIQCIACRPKGRQHIQRPVAVDGSDEDVLEAVVVCLRGRATMSPKQAANPPMA